MRFTWILDGQTRMTNRLMQCAEHSESSVLVIGPFLTSEGGSLQRLFVDRQLASLALEISADATSNKLGAVSRDARMRAQRLLSSSQPKLGRTE
jgi:hypothetical protein